MAAPVAIFSALDIEMSKLVTAATRLESHETMLGQVQTGMVDDVSVVLSRVGIGKVNAAAWAALVASTFEPRTLVFTGVAGGINPQLEVGDIVIAESLVQHDAGVSEANGLIRYQAGHVPFFNPTETFGYEPSARLVEKVRERLHSFRPGVVLGRSPQIVFGTVLTGDQFINDTTVRDQLFRDLGGHAVEMEGAAVAQVASSAGIDCLVVRSLSDLAGESSDMDFATFVEEASENSAALVRHLLPVL